MVQVYKVNDSFNFSLFENASCAFGVFDGVHQGHQYLLQCAQETARMCGGLSIALTFDIDPDEVFHADRLKKLMSNEERLKALSESGVDAVVALEFNREFAALSPMDFLEKTFNGHIPAFLHVGLDFHFGAFAKGSVAELGEWGARVGTHINAHNLKALGSRPITATRIRNLLAEHALDEAKELLGKPYILTGNVVKGRGEGGDMGFKTANIVTPPNRQVLSEGVYSAYVYVDGKKYKAAVSVGVSPVFEDRTNATCEAHILDFSGDIYGDEIAVEFVEYLRPMIKFESTEELIRTVMGNIEYVRNTLKL